MITLRWGNVLIGVGVGSAVIIWHRRLARDYIDAWSSSRWLGKHVDEQRLRYLNIAAGVLFVIFGLRALIGR